MRIAFLTDTFWPRINGVTVSVETAKKALEAAGHTVHLWAPDYSCKGMKQPNIPNGTRVKSWPLLFSSEDRVLSLFSARKLFTQLDEFQPDILHAHGEFYAAFLGKWYASLRNKPIVITAHTYFEQYALHYLPGMFRTWVKRIIPSFFRGYFKNVDAVVVPSSTMQEVIQSYGVRSAISVIPTGIEVGDFDFNDVEREGVLAKISNSRPDFSDKKWLLTASRISKEKNLELLIQALEIICKLRADIVLVIAGDGPFKAELENRISEAGLSQNVHFTGYISRQELSCLYRKAEAFVFASTTETQGLVTIEAMLHGCPVVAVGEMGTVDVMNGNRGGFMTENNALEFAEAVLKLIQNPELRHAKSMEAKKHAAGWTASAMAGKLENLYSELLLDHQVRSNVSENRWRWGFSSFSKST